MQAFKFEIKKIRNITTINGTFCPNISKTHLRRNSFEKIKRKWYPNLAENYRYKRIYLINGYGEGKRR